MRIAAVLVLALVVMAGCGGARSLVPGQSTEADVQARMGAPKDTRTEPNGDVVWEYPTGPEGFFTYAVRMGPDKRVKEITQLVSEEQLGKVVIGKSNQAEVRRLLGRPAEETVLRVGPTWYWRFLRNETSTGYLIVTFDSAGIAASKAVTQDSYPASKF